MNKIKLILTTLSLLTVAVSASTLNATTPSIQYTQMTNSAYLYSLEKKRSAALSQRAAREDQREYERVIGQLKK